MYYTTVNCGHICTPMTLRFTARAGHLLSLSSRHACLHVST